MSPVDYSYESLTLSTFSLSAYGNGYLTLEIFEALKIKLGSDRESFRLGGGKGISLLKGTGRGGTKQLFVGHMII